MQTEHGTYHNYHYHTVLLLRLLAPNMSAQSVWNMLLTSRALITARRIRIHIIYIVRDVLNIDSQFR